MKKYIVFASVSVLLLAAVAISQNFFVFGQWFNGRMIGYNEAPAISTSAAGNFDADILYGDTQINWRLSYAGLEGNITQAHIHFGQQGVNGAISVWLCSNLASPPTPPGTQPCPASPATITGIITANQVTAGAAAQGINAGEFNELLRAIRSGMTYANVHSTLFPAGEVRAPLVPGQINP